MNSVFEILGPLINRSLSAAIAIIAASFFLNFVFHRARNRVSRTFSALLFFVLVTYLGDLGVTFTDGNLDTAAIWLRFQWLGIAFVPVLYTHLSDAILELTGLPSRGRRRRAVRILYGLAAIFFLAVLLTDLVVRSPVAEPAPHFRPGPLFPVFAAYFIGAVIVSFWFVIRARNRTLTASTRRRMNYLLTVYAAPALSVFPFLLISGPSLSSPVVFYLLLIIVDVVLAVMLTVMGYTLSFFGNTEPERLIKAQMLQFFLRGPVVAIAALGVILWAPGAGRVLGLPGEEIMPLLAVLVILFFQWIISVSRPTLEQWLVYPGDEEIERIRELERRLVTGTDFRQILDTVLNAICDYLRIETAFIASLKTDGPQLERAVGLDQVDLADLPQSGEISLDGGAFVWRDFWLIPLYANEAHPNNGTGPDMIGVLGVQAPEKAPSTETEEERWEMLMALATRAAEVLEDRRLQSEVFAALEGLLPEIGVLQRLIGQADYGDIQALTDFPSAQVIGDPEFPNKIKDALAHYWGGPNLTDDALLSLAVVQRALAEHDGNPQRAMQAVLRDAIENLRPEGKRSMTTAEWILYNILEMRFLQRKKVREVYMRLAMSESDFYRKQRIAIEAVAEIISSMERSALSEELSSEPPG
ncbi:MAG: hypothetical protein GYB64_14600 [Chloroflexi bacterium]|nr:hypothetical protein [Chloroflexota bacterium]